METVYHGWRGLAIVFWGFLSEKTRRKTNRPLTKERLVGYTVTRGLAEMQKSLSGSKM